MVSFTLESTVVAVLQFMAVVGILLPVLLTHTQTGQTIFGQGNYVSGNFVAPNSIVHLQGTLGSLNQTYFVSTGKYSLQQQMSNVVSNSSNINAGVLQNLGGLAFIPAAFGLFMNSIVSLPNTLFTIIGIIFSGYLGAYVVVPVSILLISGVFATYFVVGFAWKVLTPITKVEIPDV